MRKFYAFNHTAVANEAAITAALEKLHQQYPDVVDDVATMRASDTFNPIRQLTLYTNMANIVPVASYDEQTRHLTVLQQLGSNITSLDGLERYLLDFDVALYDDRHPAPVGYTALADVVDEAKHIDLSLPQADDVYQTFAHSDIIVAAQPALQPLQQSRDTMVHQYLFNTQHAIAAARQLRQAIAALPGASWPTNNYLVGNMLGDCIHNYHQTIVVTAKGYNPVFIVNNIKDVDTYFALFDDNRTVITDASLGERVVDHHHLRQQLLAASRDRYDDNGQVVAKQTLTLPSALVAHKLSGRFRFKDNAQHTYTFNVVSAQPVVADENGVVLNA